MDDDDVIVTGLSLGKADSLTVEDDGEIPAGWLYTPNLSMRTGWEVYRVERPRRDEARVFGFRRRPVIRRGP